MNKKALVYGFIGRENFGDELMLEIHVEILKSLGFDVYYTTDSMYFPDIRTDYFFKKRLVTDHNNMVFDLILLGGGSLPLFFSSDLIMKFKTIKPKCTVIGSSINEFLHGDENYKNFTLEYYNNFFDGLIFRSDANQDFKNKIKTPNIFLPDISTCLEYKSDVNKDKTAIIIRNNVIKNKELKIILPKEPSEILMMSRSDDVYLNDLPGITNIPIIKIYDKQPIEQFKILKSYGKILSFGRFHAALCGKNDPDNTCYLYPFIENSHRIITDNTFLSWEEIKKLEKNQIDIDSSNNMSAKTGTLMTEFYNYPSCKKEDYSNFIENILNNKKL
jgi:hypothetical protein